MSEYLSTAQLAEMLGVTVKTVHVWRHEGTGPAGVRLGKHVRYARVDIDAWLAERRAADRVLARSVS